MEKELKVVHNSCGIIIYLVDFFSFILIILDKVYEKVEAN